MMCDPMATMTIRNLSDEVRERLRLRAARSGRSMEAEVRAILCQASLEPLQRDSSSALQQWVDGLYGAEKPTGVVDALIAERRRQAESE
jgi:plasmid stability protein